MIRLLVTWRTSPADPPFKTRMRSRLTSSSIVKLSSSLLSSPPSSLYRAATGDNLS